MIKIQFSHRDHSVLIQTLYMVGKSAFTSHLHSDEKRTVRTVSVGDAVLPVSEILRNT